MHNLGKRQVKYVLKLFIIIMKCKHFKIRRKKGKVYYYCTLKKEEVSFSCYQECDKKEYKEYKSIRKRTYKLAKNEKKRFSIIYSDLSKCCVNGCMTPYYKVEKNEVYSGSYRNRSIKYGAVCPMCKTHHDLFHKNNLFNLQYKVLFQQEFVSCYSLEWFINTFGQDYTVKYNKVAKNNKKSSNCIK